MTYCVGIILDIGMILASDSRTHAGLDNFAKFCSTFGPNPLKSFRVWTDEVIGAGR